MLFADISGFTPLSERLNKESGKQGCERLNALINKFFDQIINTCLVHGGDVVKFAGDAMFVVFRAEKALAPKHAVSAAIGRACLSAGAVMALDGQEQPTAQGAPIALRLHCGVGGGEMVGMTVGSTGKHSDGRFEYVVGGEPLGQITLTDKHAEAGQVLVAPKAWQLVGSTSRVENSLEVDPMGPDHGEQ
jgi:class 3 adenylate cyclase